jgi:3-hydroxyisobutyrate dehydrogenase
VTTVAFLGTGTMGFPMAQNLLDSGFAVRAWNRSLERSLGLAEHGAQIFEDPREAAEGSEFLVTMLSHAPAVLDTAAAVLDVLADGAVWLQMSTIGLDGIEKCAELAERAGVTLVDAPVLGTREPAQRGELVVLASGPAEVADACAPIFDAVGSRTMWVGEAGAGTRCKLVVNSWIVGIVAVLAETISLAEALDLDPLLFFDAIDGGALHLPYARLKGNAMIAKEFDDPSFRLALARKDADLVLAAADRVGLEVPVIHAVSDRLYRAEQAGHGDEDLAAVYRASAPSRGALSTGGRT